MDSQEDTYTVSGGSGEQNQPSQVVRPPMPKAVGWSLPGSLASSKVSSPRALSAQQSLQSLAATKLAQYRAGAKTFKEDAGPRPGLNIGDVVTLQTQEGLFTVTPLELDGKDAGAVRHALGKWLAFRAAAAGDRFLQARKRSPRLVFYNNNVGTWEHWELADEEGARLDGAPWAHTAVVLKHRRLPQFELRVELVRVGTFTLLGPGSSITPRSLTPAPQEDELSENLQLRKMSGVLMHEWFNFVDREKQLRMNIAAQVGQLVEDAADLQAWTVSQVEGMRSEMDGEVSALLEAIAHKSAKLDDANTRLTSRLRWGIAVVQAKKELSLKRQVFAWWRGIAARKRYCRHVVAKLQQRVDNRLSSRALEAWLDRYQEQKARQQRLWMAVRRMAFMKMHSAFNSWHIHAAAKRELRHRNQQLDAAATTHAQRWRLKQVFGGWHDVTNSCRHAREILYRLATSRQQRSVLLVFTAWRQHVTQQQARVDSLQGLVAARRRHDLLQQVLAGWREAVDVKHGRRLQLAHASYMLARLRQRQVLLGWQAWRMARIQRQHAWGRLLQSLQRRHTQRALAAWQDLVAYRRQQRAMLMRFVQERALSMTQRAFALWQAYTQHKRKQAYALEQLVVRQSQQFLTAGWDAWWEHVAEAKAQRQLGAACQRRCRAVLLRWVLTAWRERVAVRKAKQQLAEKLKATLQTWRAAAQACIAQRRQLLHASRILGKLRLRAAFQAWRGHTSYEQHLRVQLQTLVARRAEQLSQAAFCGWQQRVAYKRSLTMRMWESTMRISSLRMGWAFRVWRQEASERAQAKRALSSTQRRIARHKVAAAFQAWRQQTARLAESRAAAEQLAEAQAHVLQQDCFNAWADFAAQRADQQVSVLRFVQRRATWVMSNTLLFWRSFVQHKAARRQQLQRAWRKLHRVRLQQVFSAWQQWAAERANKQRTRSLRTLAAGQKLQAARALAGQAKQAQLAAAFYSWQETVSVWRHARCILGRLARRTDGQLVAGAFRAWRQQVHRMQHLEQAVGNLGAKRHRSQLLATFQTWSAHTSSLRATRAAVNSRHQAESSVLWRLALRSWRSHTSQRRQHRAHVLEKCVDKQASLRAQAVMLRAVDRLCMRVTRGAFEAWREGARARKARRTAIARFMQRWQQQRLRTAQWHWQAVLQERKTAADNLRRCLIRKRVAFKLFRNWYWESFDDEMQETLRTMFEVTNEAAADPLPSRMGSPVTSLLSSPIRAQLGYARGHISQHQQLAAGVAQRLAQPGSLQPAYLRYPQGPSSQGMFEGLVDDSGIMHATMHLGLQMGGPAAAALRQPLPPQPAPLHERVTSAPPSPVRTAQHLLPVPNLYGSFLAPLSHIASSLQGRGPAGEPAAGQLAAPEGLPRLSPAHRSSPPLEQHEQRVTPQAESGSVGLSSNSKVASTIQPRSPLTPSSAGFGGGTPITQWATPNPDGMFTVQRVPGTVSALRRPPAEQHFAASPTNSTASSRPAMPAFSPALPGQQPQHWGYSPAAAAVARQYTPLSQARTPAFDTHAGAASPELYAEPTPDPDLRGYSISPGLLQQLEAAATPLPPPDSLETSYRTASERLSGAQELPAALATAKTAFHTPMGSFKTPPPGFPELQGDYSMRRLSASVLREARELAGATTPNPDLFIAAYPGTVNRGGYSEGELDAAKTPLYDNPMCLASPGRRSTELD
ncbi:hypothetical protein N2152v2_004745 [Parachlorella kessleri]